MNTFLPSLLLLILSAGPLSAALGETKTIEDISPKGESSPITVERFASHTVIETTEAYGLKIREFVGSDLKVFGIAWEGPRLPDFEQILGSQLTEFKNTAAASNSRRGPLSKNSGNLAFFSGKYQRTFEGRAYLKDLVPSGVSQSVIK